MFRQNLTDHSGYFKMPLTAPSHLLESSILTKHKSLKAEEAATSKQETSEKVGDLNTSSVMFKVDKSNLFKSGSDWSLKDKPGPPELAANHLFTSNLLTSPLTTYQHSALVCLKSSLLESQTNNLAGIPVKSLIDKNTGSASYHCGASPECLNKRVDGISTRQKLPMVSENVQRHKEKVDRGPDRKRDKSSDRKRNKSSDRKRDKSSDRKGGKRLELKKKGALQKGKPRLDKEETGEDGISSYFADKSIPDYNFKKNFKPEIVDLPKFLPPDKDHDILRSTVFAERLKEIDKCLMQPKRALLNAASASLIQAPNFKDLKDGVRFQLIKVADKVADRDPEFVLKVALYTRCELNIRTTANFLLAYASNQPSCRPYLQKYFKATVCLPSDWIEVAEIYQGFHDQKLSRGSLPTALRKAMVAKFPDFDVYQLSKYNKEKSAKKKTKKEEKPSSNAGEGAEEDDPAEQSGDKSSGEEKEEDKENDTGKDADSEAQLSFTLKQLIRKLHVMEPVEHVMCLIGKRYPSNLDEFYQKRLPGTFDEEKAGKRMKLPIAETWETQVSLKGNKASTWEELIDHRKLPFMAMLRNLRNMIKAGISEKHHSWVINKLSDEGAVTHSKQFPFRFFSAYEVLGQLEKELEQREEDEDLVRASEGPETITLEIGGERVTHVVPSDSGSGSQGRGGAGGRGRGGAARRGRGGAASGRGRGGTSGGRGRAGSRGAGGRGGTRGGGARGGRARGGGARGGGARGGGARGGGARGRGKPMGTKSAKARSGGICYDQILLTRYRKALDCAVKIATVHNIKPIRGTTIILCSLDEVMTSTTCTAAKGLGKPRTMAEIAVLLGLMCKHSCEKCEFIVYGSGNMRNVELEKGTILHNMERVLKLKEIVNDRLDDAERVKNKIDRYLLDMLIDRTQVNNIIFLTGGDYHNDALKHDIRNFVEKYRTVVSPDLLFVTVNLAGKQSGHSSFRGLCNENDITISGFSDQLLRFVAEKGEGAQLTQVEKIDEAFNLKPLPKAALGKRKEAVIASPENPLALVSLIPRWRTVRVFISSTFRDMHGERDLLTRFVFPELRSRAEKRFLNIYEVDLRWGISEEDAQSKRTLELCLSQVKNCQLFVGIVGERYGWVPKHQDIPQRPEFDWVFGRLGASITELEMYSAALSCPSKAVDNAFFYFRDNSFEKDIPKDLQSDFTAENYYSAMNLKELKALIGRSGLEVYDRYPCRWGGVVGGKSLVAGLDEFGLRVLNNLWNALQKLYPEEDNFLDETMHEHAQHENFFASLRDRLVGRKAMLKKAFETLKKTSSGLVMVHGKPGSGKSSIMAALALRCIEEHLVESGLDVLVHCVGAAPDSANVVAMLRRLCHELGRRINSTSDLPNHFKNLVDRFYELLEESSKAQSEQKPLVIFLDGLDLLEKLHDAPSLNWLPETIPKNVLLVVSVCEESVGHRSLRQRKDVSAKICVDLLDTLDKAEVIRQTLSTHAKRLDESMFNNQLRILASKRESNIPLYLSLACEEVRVFGVFEKVTQKLQSLPHTLTQLMNESLSRIESDNGTQLVALSLSLLFCSRKGLEEDELSSLLSLDLLLNGSYSTVDDIRNVYLSPELMIPSVTILRLIRSLNSFLRPFEASSYESTLLKLDQVQVRTVIHQRYLKGPYAMHENKLHQLLAGYYYTVADPDHNSGWLGKNPKAFAELPYHLACAGCYHDLKKVLCDLMFIHAKSRLGLAVQTLSDFDVPSGFTTVLERERMKLLSDVQLMEYQNFISRNLHILSTHPVLTLQQALNEPSQSLPSADAERMLLKDCRAMEGAGLMRWTNKREEFDGCLRTMSDLPAVVTCVAMSADGVFLAAGFKDCTIKLYERKLPALVKELKTFSGHSNSISGLCFSSGLRLCSASADGTLSLWSILGGHRISVLRGHTRCVASCAADAAGKVIVSVGWDFAIKLWNGVTGEAQGNLATDQHPVNCVAFHPEGQLIVTGDWGATLKLWDVFNKCRKGILRGHSSSVRDVAFSPSGRHIASAALDGEVKIWSAAYGSNVGVIHGQILPINRISFSPTGQELVTVSDDQKVKVWSGNIGRPIGHIGQKEDYGPVVCVAFDATGEHVAAGYHEGFVRLFGVESGNLVWEKSFFKDPVSVRCIKFKSVEEIDVWTLKASTSSLALFAGTAKGTIMMLNVSTGDVKCTLEGHAKSVMCLDVGQRSRNGFVVTAGEDFIVNLYEYANLDKSSSAKPCHTLEGHSGPVTCCALNMDETKLATGSRDKNVIIWDLGTARHVKQERILYRCHSDWITCCAWSNTRNFLVTGSSDFNLKLWDMKTGTEKVKFTGHMSAISSVAYSYGCIVSSCNDGLVKVWSHSGAEVTTLYGHTQRANSCDIYVEILREQETKESTDWATMADEEEWVAKHEESKANKADVKVERVVVATCSDDGTIRLWLPNESSELACLTGHSGKVVALACGRGGSICSAALDGTLKLWKVPDVAAASSGHAGEVTAIACSVDGSTVATVSRDGMMKIWSRQSSDGEMFNVPQILLDIKVSKKSVNCVRFLAERNDRLFTGSDDCTVALWHLTLGKNPQAQKLADLTMSSPVVSLAVATQSDVSRNKLFVTQLLTAVSIVTVDNLEGLGGKRPSMTISFEYAGVQDWSLASAYDFLDGNSGLLTCGASGHILLWNIHQMFEVNVVKKKTRSWHDRDDQKYTTLRHLGHLPWTTCLTISGNVMYCGDSSGKLECWHRVLDSTGFSSQREMQIHTGKVTSILCKGDLIFTGSTDKTVKVWNRDLEQVGQFFCKAPVTSLTLLPTDLASVKQHQLVCGNDLGEVLFLNWRS